MNWVWIVIAFVVIFFIGFVLGAVIMSALSVGKISSLCDECLLKQNNQQLEESETDDI